MISSMKAAMAATALSLVALSGAQQIQVQVDGNQVMFPNAQPQYVDGHVLVPLRGVFQQMGATVKWDRYTRTVYATTDRSDVRLRVGDRRASVNGSQVNMEVPAMLINGSTMIPIRFVAEALGAEVDWREANNLVSINTGMNQPDVGNSGYRDRGRTNTQGDQRKTVIVHQNEVIPVTLDQNLSSTRNRSGDGFSATVRTGPNGYYGDLPRGTQLFGHVAAVSSRHGNGPAILDLAFDKIVFPNGKETTFSGTLTSLDGAHVIRDDSGHMMARQARNGKDQRMVYAGYGAGAGLLVGVAEKRPIDGAILGGVVGYIVGQVQHDKRETANITLVQGTLMGVRVNRQTAVAL